MCNHPIVILMTCGCGYNGWRKETAVQRSRHKKRRVWDVEEPTPAASKSARAKGPPTRSRWIKRAGIALVVLGAVAVVAVFAKMRMGKNSLPVLGCEVVASFPHAEDAFTQGLV